MLRNIGYYFSHTGCATSNSCHKYLEYYIGISNMKWQDPANLIGNMLLQQLGKRLPKWTSHAQAMSLLYPLQVLAQGPPPLPSSAASVHAWWRECNKVFQDRQFFDPGTYRRNLTLTFGPLSLTFVFCTFSFYEMLKWSRLQISRFFIQTDSRAQLLCLPLCSLDMWFRECRWSEPEWWSSERQMFLVYGNLPGLGFEAIWTYFSLVEDLLCRLWRPGMMINTKSR